MRAMHVHGDEQIAALWRLPRRFAEDPVDLAFTPERLRSIRARTLIVAGDRDPLYPVESRPSSCCGASLPHRLWIVPGGRSRPDLHVSER